MDSWIQERLEAFEVRIGQRSARAVSADVQSDSRVDLGRPEQPAGVLLVPLCFYIGALERGPSCF